MKRRRAKYYDIATMNPSFSTALQSWSRARLVLTSCLLLALHAGVFLIGAFVTPTMFHDAHIPGTVCVLQGDATATWYKDSASEGQTCVPAESKVESLDASLLAFRFPTENSKPKTYSRWNWRLLGSLHMRLSFSGQDFPSSGENQTTSYSVNRRNVPVMMEAKLDASDQHVADPTMDEHFRLFDWVRQSEIIAERKLQCSITSAQSGEATIDYSCTLTPLLTVELLANQSYILQLQFFASNNATEAQKEFSIVDKPVMVKELSLVLVVEDEAFHAALFYLKCLSMPFVLGALVMFSIRLYLNDLYVSIPDRLLITCALAQIIHNVPVEALIAEGSLWDASPYLKLLDDLSRYTLISCLFLFWLVYTKDKISTKEPWERNTKYYWRQIIAVILGGLIAAMWALYGRGPSFQNAFKNHWLVETPTVIVSLGLIFSLAALALAFQTYLSVLIFRALCDISVSHYRQHYCSSSGRSYIPQRVCRIKMVLLYSFAVSVLTIGGLVLQLAMELSLHWNPQFYMNAIPFHLTFAASYILGLNGLWNLYIVALLIMLARSTESRAPDEYYVRPISYNENIPKGPNIEGLEDSDECVLESLTSNHYHQEMPTQNLRRRQSSEDFLDMRAAREADTAVKYCRHNIVHNDICCEPEFSSSPDPYEDEDAEALVDEDPLEVAKQESIHLWENDFGTSRATSDSLRVASASGSSTENVYNCRDQR